LRQARHIAAVADDEIAETIDTNPSAISSCKTARWRDRCARLQKLGRSLRYRGDSAGSAAGRSPRGSPDL
jgi:hypothetical protein